MSRERAFIESEVLDHIADAFITHGYGGTSLARLQAATGLGRKSLYNTFGDKRAMYLQAIEHVRQRYALATAMMAACDDGRAAVDAYFRSMVNRCASPSLPLRNYIGTSGLLEFIDEPLLTDALTRFWRSNFDLLQQSVERGQRDGSIVNPAAPDELAEVLCALVSGLRVAAQVGRSRAQLDRLVDHVLGVLDVT